MPTQSSLFVRQSSGLVREASVIDAIIFNAVFSAPVGATLAFGIFYALAYIVLAYTQLGIATTQLGPLPGFIFMGALIVIGLVIYFVARFTRSRQGINLDLIYSELPPE